jgi:DNA-binding Xre family transcriptional regulator
MTISNQLKGALNGSGMTVYRLSRESGVDKAVLYRFLSGERRTLTLATVDRLCKCLGLELKSGRRGQG